MCAPLTLFMFLEAGSLTEFKTYAFGWDGQPLDFVDLPVSRRAGITGVCLHAWLYL